MAKVTKKVKPRISVGLSNGDLWAINPEGLERALNKLGIYWNVKITRTSREGRGGHASVRNINGKYVHYICINKYLDHEGAVRLILHELRHAYQLETVGNDCDSYNELLSKWNDHKGFVGKYWSQPFEIEARLAERRFPDFMDIVIPGKYGRAAYPIDMNI